MKITELLDRPIAYHRVFVTLTGSVKAAILLSQAVYWQKRAKQSDGWWYKTADEWEDETGLTRHELDKARQDCAAYLKTDLRDAPARMYWHVDDEALSAALFAENRKSSLPESVKLDCRKSSNIKRNTETTTETTTVDYEDVRRLYEDNIGVVNPLMLGLIRNASMTYPKAWFQPAFELAAKNNARSWRYVETILESWKTNGFGWKPEKPQPKGFAKPDKGAMFRAGLEKMMQEVQSGN